MSGCKDPNTSKSKILRFYNDVFRDEFNEYQGAVTRDAEGYLHIDFIALLTDEFQRMRRCARSSQVQQLLKQKTKLKSPTPSDASGCEGDTYFAFHALCRSMRRLEHLKMIRENLWRKECLPILKRVSSSVHGSSCADVRDRTELSLPCSYEIMLLMMSKNDGLSMLASCMKERLTCLVLERDYLRSSTQYLTARDREAFVSLERTIVSESSNHDAESKYRAAQAASDPSSKSCKRTTEGLTRILNRVASLSREPFQVVIRNPASSV